MSEGHAQVVNTLTGARTPLDMHDEDDGTALINASYNGHGDQFITVSRATGGLEQVSWGSERSEDSRHVTAPPSPNTKILSALSPAWSRCAKPLGCAVLCGLRSLIWVILVCISRWGE